MEEEPERNMSNVADQVAPDGSPVAVYRALPPRFGFDPVFDALSAPTTVLDLGCGVGRLANLLAADGHQVTGVDESEQMLQHLDQAVTPVAAAIEGLRLGRHFEVVVLASHLINVPDPALRSAFLAAAAEHVARDGSVLIEHYGADPRALDDHPERLVGGVGIRLRILDRRGSTVDGEVTYRVDDHTWVQRFTAEMLDEEVLAAALRDAGLRVVRTLSRTWLEATPV
jgi:SAM-dependent methyltransferase